MIFERTLTYSSDTPYSIGCSIVMQLRLQLFCCVSILPRRAELGPRSQLKGCDWLPVLRVEVGGRVVAKLFASYPLSFTISYSTIITTILYYTILYFATIPYYTILYHTIRIESCLTWDLGQDIWCGVASVWVQRSLFYG